jgi:excisionase family DNA binding protein
LLICPRLYNLCTVRIHAPSETGELLTIKAAADALGVSEQTLRRWDRAGKLRPMRHPMNGYRLYRREVINDLKRQIGGLGAKR